MKLADVAPAAIVTVEGTVAQALFEVRPITAPPVGAPLVIVTVPVEFIPPETELGDKVTLVIVTGVIVRFAY